MRKPPGHFWGTCIKDPSTAFFIHSLAKWYVLFYLATLNSRKMSTKLNIITNLFTVAAFNLSSTISRKLVTDQIPMLHSGMHQNSCWCLHGHQSRSISLLAKLSMLYLSPILPPLFYFLCSLIKDTSTGAKQSSSWNRSCTRNPWTYFLLPNLDIEFW